MRIAALALSSLLAGPALGQTLEIVEATYGSGSYLMNVTQKLRELVRDNRLDISAEPGTLGGDPSPGTAKTLRVRYRWGGSTYEASAGDFQRLVLPSITAGPITVSAPAAATPVPAPVAERGGRFSVGDLWGTTATLRIAAARWGAGDKWLDVRERVQSLVKDDKAAVKADNAVLGGDPAVGKTKSLEVTYEYKGAGYQVSAREGRTLNLPDSSAKPAPVVASAPPAASSPAASSPAATVPATTAPAAAAAQAPVSGAPVASTASVSPLGSPGGLRIFYARYGAGPTMVDVRERLRPLLKPDSLSVTVNAQNMGGDPLPGTAKVLDIIYEFKGRTFERVVDDGATLSIP